MGYSSRNDSGVAFRLSFRVRATERRPRPGDYAAYAVYNNSSVMDSFVRSPQSGRRESAEARPDYESPPPPVSAEVSTRSATALHYTCNIVADSVSASGQLSDGPSYSSTERSVSPVYAPRRSYRYCASDVQRISR